MAVEMLKSMVQRKSRRTKQKIQSPCVLWFLVLMAPFLAGGFFEWSAAILSAGLAGILIYICRKSGGLQVYLNLPLLTVAVVVLSYGLGAVWAVDRGMAVFGFVKFLPWLLFLLLLMQTDSEERRKALDAVWLSGIVMVLLSDGLRVIPAFERMLFVNHRLAGFFQYPNTFALFLLSGVIILVGEGQWERKRLLYLIILTVGIMQTGSRTTFVLLTLIFVFCGFSAKDRRMRAVLAVLLAGTVMVTFFYVMLTGNVASVGRYLTFSLKDSTFLGRLLYFKDAVPVILRSPLGLGYMGYYYTQGSFQTGVYTVLHIHNEPLQFLLDIGWIPGILFAAFMICSVFSKNVGRTGRLLILAIGVHSMFDFDFQFVAIGFVLLLVTDVESGKVWSMDSKRCLYVVCVLLGVVSVWLGSASAFYHMGRYETAVRIYPGYTEALAAMLPGAEDLDTMEMLADRILSKNQSMAVAYDAKARGAYAEGDFAKMILYKQKAIGLTRYRLEEYVDYLDMLQVGVRLYEENGDADSAGYCLERMKEVPGMMEQVLKETDALAWEIEDKPELVLPEKYREMCMGDF